MFVGVEGKDVVEFVVVVVVVVVEFVVEWWRGNGLKAGSGSVDVVISWAVDGVEPDMIERRFTIFPFRRPIEESEAEKWSACLDARERWGAAVRPAEVSWGVVTDVRRKRDRRGYVLARGIEEDWGNVDERWDAWCSSCLFVRRRLRRRVIVVVEGSSRSTRWKKDRVMIDPYECSSLLWWAFFVWVEVTWLYCSLLSSDVSCWCALILVEWQSILIDGGTPFGRQLLRRKRWSDDKKIFLGATVVVVVVGGIERKYGTW